MADFSDVIGRWVEETQAAVDNTLQTIAIRVGETLVTLSPVDTGRFKGNWQLTIGDSANASLIREDPTGFATINEMKSKVSGFTAGQIAYIQNFVLYGYDLEYGSSKQAPDGVLRITAARFQQLVNEAARIHAI